MSHNYSNAEYYDMLLCVGAAEGSCHGGRELYRQRFVDGRPIPEQRRLPSYECFRSLCMRVHSTGSVRSSSNEGRPSMRLGSNLETRILQYFNENPRASTRRAAAAFETNHVVIWRTLKDDGQHPYHFRRTQELLPLDFSARVAFCQWLQTEQCRDEAFVSKVLWSDEASFTRSGLVNSHNEHVWSHVNPHAYTTGNYQHQWRINVWAGILADRVIGPIFLPTIMDANAYLQLLTGELEDQLEDLSVSAYYSMWFQHDGAPAHYSRNVRAYMNSRFPEQWIGRGSTVPWPPRSPDLTPLDFFLWGYIKNVVYAVECNTREDMIERIRQAFLTVTPQMLHNVLTSVSRRACLCLEREGQHFEPFL